MNVDYNGAAIRAIRIKSHLTQKTVATAAGVSQGHIANVEAGRDRMKDGTARLVAVVLGIDDMRAIVGKMGETPIPVIPDPVG